MPFTPTHILAVVPIAAVRRWRLPFAALAIGSMIPDLPLFVPFVVGYQVTHSPAGLLTADLPLGLAAFLAYQLSFRDLLFALLPAAVQRRCVACMRTVVVLNPGFIARAAVAVVLGAFTHLAWDSFTHHERTGTMLIPRLNEPALVVGGHALPGYKVLQYGSTVVGLPILAILLVRRLRRQPPEPLAAVPLLPPGRKYLAWIVAGVIPAAAVAHVSTRVDLSAYQKLSWVVTRSGAPLLVVLLAAALALQVGARRPVAAKPPPAPAPEAD